MVNEIQYISIKRVLDNLLDHPMLRDLTLDQAIRYTVRFIGINGFPKFYKDAIADVEIQEYRGLLPCDLIRINQVKDLKTGVCLRHMADNFPTGMVEELHPSNPSGHLKRHPDGHLEKDKKPWYIPPSHHYFEEPAFKTQGRVIFTTFPCGVVGISYKSIPVDENGFPMLIDNENYLRALEAYIKMQVFQVKFDMGKIAMNVLQQAQTDYAWAAGSLDAEFKIPSESEMETYTRMFNTLIPQVRKFDDGFKHLGDREYIRNH